MLRATLLLILVVVRPVRLFAQLFGAFYASPLDIPLEMAGNFCELRSNHFHSGIDFRTNKQEGYPVFAVAPGFISRIKVSPFGYGNALYIDHPNGTTSVYGHLRNFDTLIENWVRAEQYRRKTFEVDLFPPKDLFPMKQCDLIAWSGNSGGSEGPHLHFEIRNTKSEEPLDPLDLGFIVPDEVAPELLAVLAIVEKQEGYPDTLRIWKRSKNSNSGDTISVRGPLNFLAELSDRETPAGSKNAVKSYGLLVGKDTAFVCSFNRFPFHHSRMVNAHIDYKRFKKSGRRFQRFYTLPGQKLNFYRQNPAFLPLRPDSGSYVTCTWFATDVAGYQSSLSLVLHFTNSADDSLFNQPDSLDALNPSVVVWNRKNEIVRKNFKISFPENAVYENVTLRTAWIPSNDKAHLSEIVKVHEDIVPLDKAFTISIKKKSGLPFKAPRVAIYRLGKNRKSGTFVETKEDGEYLTGSSRVFGEFVLMADAEPPQVTKADISVALEDTLRRTPLKWKVKDLKSGVSASGYELSVDGQWLLAGYDPKEQLIYYWPDEHLLPERKERLLRLAVRDQAGNVRIWKKKIVY